MSGFILSFRSEFYKTRKTAAFWSPILLPLLLCLLIFVGFYGKSAQMANEPGFMLWLQFSGSILGIMGSLILPMLIVFIAYSVNSIEHKADTWKTLFSLPINKFSIYAAKYFYALSLVFLCLLLFVLFTLGFGNLLSILKPGLKFNEYSVFDTLTGVYIKLFLASLAILSIQFILSLLLRDFLKPMGIGFVATIMGVILVGTKWKYNYLFPYSYPMLAIQSLERNSHNSFAGPVPQISINIITKETFISLIIAVIIFTLGYIIVLRKSIK